MTAVSILKEAWPFIAASAAGLFTFIKWYFGSKKTTRPSATIRTIPEKRHALKTIHAINQIYHELNSITFETQCAKAVLCKVHNGGDIPAKSKPIYVTAMYETSFKIRSGNKYWQRMPLDGPYAQLIETLFLEKQFTVVTKDLKDSLLKKALRSAQINCCMYAEVFIEPESYYFLAVPFLREVSELDSSYEFLVQKSANRLRAIFES